MSFFSEKDLRERACADLSATASVGTTVRRHAVATSLALCILAAFYAGNVFAGMRAHAGYAGVVRGLPVRAPVVVERESNGTPHVRAENLRDLFFAQGYVEASDRAFQMDVTRRYAYGRLAEIFGPAAVSSDSTMRVLGLRELAALQYRSLSARERSWLSDFAAGADAAFRGQPLPVEFRMLAYAPERWSPIDSVAVALVAAWELSDSWRDVLRRNDAWEALGAACYDAAFPLSDPHYDVTATGVSQRRGSASLQRCPRYAFAKRETRTGSNAWAAAGPFTATGRALIANDPHVDVTIPGIWYVMDLSAPGLHAAGAVIPGLPGIALGHNERLAWAVTNAEAATTAVYRGRVSRGASPRLEAIGVRLGRPRFVRYRRLGDTFSIPEDPGTFVRWTLESQRRSTIADMLALDRAATVRDAIRILSRYRGAPENFVLADARGNIAYHLAGAVIDDPAWGRYAHDASALRARFQTIPFDRLPSANGVRVRQTTKCTVMAIRTGSPRRSSFRIAPTASRNCCTNGHPTTWSSFAGCSWTTIHR